MNILVFTREYKHEKLPSCGGTGVFYSQLTKELVKNGHQVTVFGVNKTNYQFKDEGVTVNFTKNLFKKNRLINLIRSISGKIFFLNKLNLYLYKLELKIATQNLINYIHINDLSIDIIETHDFDGMSLYLKKYKYPYVIRTHGSWTVLEKKFNYKNVSKGRKYCEKEAFKKAENIISISRFSQKVNHELFEIEKFKLIYNGVDTSLFKTDKKINVIPKSIFYFGNTSIEKGADIAINSFLEIIKKDPETSLHFLGKETTFKNEITRLINDNGIKNKVCFYGIQQTTKAIEILSQASIIIFPSKGENFSLAILEAMSLSKIIICSNLDAFNEVVEDGHNGFIAKDTKEFIQKIGNVLSNSEKYLEIGVNARKTIVDNFSIEKMVKETTDHYNLITKNHKKRNEL